MPNALVIGASGYVGAATAQQMLRQGNFQTFAIAETEEDALTLSRDEIQPLHGDATTASGISAFFSQGNIDVIIDTTSYNDVSTKSTLLANIVEAAKLRSATRPKLGLVTVSGIWTQGSTEDPNGTFRRIKPADRALNLR